jgi:hypothetical protein
MKKCSYCGKEHTDEATSCSIDGHPLVPLRRKEPIIYTVHVVGSDEKKKFNTVTPTDAAIAFSREVVLPQSGWILVHGSDGTTEQYVVRNATVCDSDEGLKTPASSPTPITPQRPAQTSTVHPPSSTRKKRITSISIHQTSKVLTILFVAIGLVFIPIGVLFILAGYVGMGIIYVLMPFIYGIIGYPYVAMMCWVYNLIAKNVGGVEFTVEDETDAA